MKLTLLGSARVLPQLGVGLRPGSGWSGRACRSRAPAHRPSSPRAPPALHVIEKNDGHDLAGPGRDFSVSHFSVKLFFDRACRPGYTGVGGNDGFRTSRGFPSSPRNWPQGTAFCASYVIQTPAGVLVHATHDEMLDRDELRYGDERDQASFQSCQSDQQRGVSRLADSG